MEERFSSRFSISNSRDTFLSHISAKTIEEGTRIELLKCENFFLEQDIVKKIEEKKGGSHYQKLILKLRQCDEIMQGLETRNLRLQGVLAVKDEEIAQLSEKIHTIDDDNQKLKYENAQLLRENSQYEREISGLRAQISEELQKPPNDDLLSLKEKELEQIHSKFRLACAENDRLKHEREDFKRKIEKFEEKLKENERNECELQGRIRSDSKDTLQLTNRLKGAEADLKSLRAKLNELQTINEELQSEKARFAEFTVNRLSSQLNPIALNKEEEGRMKPLRDEIFSLTTENQELRVKLDVSIVERSRLEEKLSRVEEENLRFLEEHEDLQVKIDVLESEKSKLAEKFKGLEQELETIKGKNLLLFNEICAKNVAKAQENQQLRSENDELKHKLSNIEENLSCASEKTTLKDQSLNTIQERNSILKKEIDRVSRQNKKYSTDKLNCVQENLAFKQEIEDLKKELANSEDLIAKLEAKGKQSQKKLTEKDEEIFALLEKFESEMAAKTAEIDSLKKRNGERSLNERGRGGNIFLKKKLSIDNHSKMTSEENTSYYSCQSSFDCSNNVNSNPMPEEKKMSSFLKEMRKMDII